MLLSPAPQALSFVIKEKLFREYPNFDLFVMNSHSSLFQFLLQPLFVPIAFFIIPQLSEGTHPLKLPHNLLKVIFF